MVKHSCGVNKNLPLQHKEYQNINFTVVIISHNYLPIALGLNIIKYVFELFMSMSIHNHENYRKNHSLKMLFFSQMNFGEIPQLNSRLSRDSYLLYGKKMI